MRIWHIWVTIAVVLLALMSIKMWKHVRVLDTVIMDHRAKIERLQLGFELRAHQLDKLQAQVDRLQQVVDEMSRVTVKGTAYNAISAQTDSDPDVTACMSDPNVGSIAVSQDLYFKGWTCGKRVHIRGLGIFTIKDVMHQRKTNQIDIVKRTKRQALVFGVVHGLNAVLLSNYEKMQNIRSTGSGPHSIYRYL